MRLIDADKLMERMYHDAFETDSDMQKWDSGCWIRYKMFENAMDSAPTVEERKKGKWIPKDDRRYHCSSCDGIAPKGYRWDFCPDCGADMRGEQE